MPTFNLTNKKKYGKVYLVRVRQVFFQNTSKKINFKRTIHPLHSVSIFGKNINKIKLKIQPQVLVKVQFGNGFALQMMFAIYHLDWD